MVGGGNEAACQLLSTEFIDFGFLEFWKAQSELSAECAVLEGQEAESSFKTYRPSETRVATVSSNGETPDPRNG